MASQVRGCALFSDGSAQCWGGFNFSGELGVGDTRERKTPAWVLGLHGATNLTLASTRTCAITKEDGLLCWGRPLPDPGIVRTAVSRPTKVDGVSSPVSAALGDDHACALDASGALFCWGANDEGQLGVGASVTSSTTPTAVPGLPPVAGVVADHDATVVWTRDGRLFIWGRQGSTGSSWSFDTPHEVKGLTDVRRAMISKFQACALKSTGDVGCFSHESLTAFEAGKEFDFGPQLQALARALAKQPGGKVARNKKQKPFVGSWIFPDGRGLSGVSDLVVFNHDATAVTANGEVFSWGNPERGTIGHAPDSKGFLGPTKIVGLTDAVSVVGGFMHRCALDRQGVVRCFGEGKSGTLGTAERRDAVEAVVVDGLPKVTALASNEYCLFAMGEDGVVYVWGRSWIGACGIEDTENPTPGPVALRLSPAPSP